MAAAASKSPAQVLELPEDASLPQIESAYARGLGLLDAQSMAAYGMFDAQSAHRLREELTVAYRALKAAAARAPLSEPPPASAPNEMRTAEPEPVSTQAVPAGPGETGLSARAPKPASVPKTPPAVTDPSAGPSARGTAPAPAVPERAPRPPGASSGQEACPAAEKPAPSAPAVTQTPPPRAIPAMALSPDALKVRLCAPRADPLAEPLTGAILKQLRESLGANVDDVCEVTKINRRYIVALEEEDFSLLPATVYVRGFVGEYARVLGLQAQAAAAYVEAYARWSSSHS